MEVQPVSRQVTVEQGVVEGKYSTRLPSIFRRVGLVVLSAFALYAMSSIPTAEAGLLCFTVCMSSCTAATGGAFTPACVAACVAVCSTNPV